MVKKLTVPLKPKSVGMEMCVMGPRSSGKTTYLAALLSLGMKEDGRNKIRSGGEKIGKLNDLLTNFIQQNQSVPPTDVNSEYDYTFGVDIKDATRILSASKIILSVKDLSGERLDNIFQSFVDPTGVRQEQRQQLKNQTDNFLDDCFKLDRWMFMMTEWQPERDKEFFEPVFRHLCDRIEANSRLKTVKELRIAVVMAKCERGEIWGSRLDPEADLFKVRLPRTYKLLKDRLDKKVKFFASSAFGVLGVDDPRPNRFYTDNPGIHAENRSRLRDYEKWTPYGVIEPIYWLATGENLHNEYI